MQRPSFALAVLFGALASGLLAANVAPCQVIVVFHASTEGPVEDVTAAEMPPADAPVAEAPPAEPPTEAPQDEVAADDASASPAETAPAAEAFDLSDLLPADAAPVDAPIDAPVDAPAEETTEATETTESEAAAPVPSDSTKKDADWLLDELFDEPKKGPEESVPAAESTIAVESAPAAESVPGDALSPAPAPEASQEAESPVLEMTDALLEPLHEAARDAAVTLDEAADWMQSMAAGLRAWAGE